MLYALADVETDFEMSTRWRSFKDEPPEHHQWIEAYFRKDSITERCPGIEIRRWDDGMKYDVFEQELYVGWYKYSKRKAFLDKLKTTGIVVGLLAVYCVAGCIEHL